MVVYHHDNDEMEIPISGLRFNNEKICSLLTMINSDCVEISDGHLGFCGVNIGIPISQHKTEQSYFKKESWQCLEQFI